MLISKVKKREILNKVQLHENVFIRFVKRLTLEEEQIIYKLYSLDVVR